MYRDRLPALQGRRGLTEAAGAASAVLPGLRDWVPRRCVRPGLPGSGWPPAPLAPAGGGWAPACPSPVPWPDGAAASAAAPLCMEAVPEACASATPAPSCPEAAPDACTPAGPLAATAPPLPARPRPGLLAVGPNRSRAQVTAALVSCCARTPCGSHCSAAADSSLPAEASWPSCSCCREAVSAAAGNCPGASDVRWAGRLRIPRRLACCWFCIVRARWAVSRRRRIICSSKSGRHPSDGDATQHNRSVRPRSAGTSRLQLGRCYSGAQALQSDWALHMRRLPARGGAGHQYVRCTELPLQIPAGQTFHVAKSCTRLPSGHSLPLPYLIWCHDSAVPTLL